MLSREKTKEKESGFGFCQYINDYIMSDPIDDKSSVESLVASYLYYAGRIDRASVEISPDSFDIAASCAEKIWDICDRLRDVYTEITDCRTRLLILVLLVHSSNYLVDADLEAFADTRLSELEAEGGLSDADRLIISCLQYAPEQEIERQIARLKDCEHDSAVRLAFSLASLSYPSLFWPADFKNQPFE